MSATDVAANLGCTEGDVAAVIAGLVSGKLLTTLPLDDPTAAPHYIITDEGRNALLMASRPDGVTANLPTSIDAVFAEASGSPDVTFLADVRSAGFGAGDARDLAYLVAEYGIGASIETNDFSVLIHCAKLSKLAGHLAARI
jgi:hypothetical protein